ncbi:uncharacterized protein FOMMEDRAFT_133827 [Fomitiporia mediterranea MF3/22]|uniref:uncharacterized protein n=1 Tax=Fomitiporia mediterranea (strain MF3/22) TaxID=694068 RepID=UPI0004409504|nr:uncharacterized protein FOMMEDRAFT_133827 [Fomitiporia mediterranea MF3/22]EJD04597.1 hypothetical protein FOMMEDRAFT_133827 [Fomitiporia mediterranea MF3/22]
MTNNKPPRAPPTPSPTPAPHHGPKLPKFLQKATTRDRSKSVIDPIMQHSGSTSASADGSLASSSSSSGVISVGETSSSPPSLPSGSGSRHRGDRRTSKLKGTLKELKDDRIGQIGAHAQSGRERELLDEDENGSMLGTEEMPVIVEPASPAPSSSRSRTRSERPLSASSSDSHPAVNYYPSSHSTQRISEMSVGSRLSGWFSHTFSTSSTDLSLPNILANTTPLTGASKSKSGGLGILTAAKHGKGHLDKAMRYLLDSDATPDKCTDPIWLLGVQHPGYEPPPPPPSQSSSAPPSGRRSSLDIRRSSSIRNSVSSLRGATSSPEPSMVHPQKNPGANWPPGFYSDFSSRVWLTYRSHYPPIRDQTLAQLEAEASGQIPLQPVSASPRKWHILGSGEKGWTSDSGWGCMLRTGQSLLANALIHLHLGRDWRRPPQPVYTVDYATYVKILTWFFDSTDIHCPFSVHRMALAGKDLGKDVGQWFGPSTAAGAIKTVVHAFAEAGLGVSVATDGVVYETDVLAASNAGPYMYRHSRMATSSPSTRRRRSAQQQQSMMSIWGQRPVLVLVGIRLGIDCVNPVYYDAVKALFTFPQSVGIAGGRPSSSYYFVGVQTDNLFYLDPHHSRPSVPFRPPPANVDMHNFNRNYGHTASLPADSPPSSYREVYTIHGTNTSRHVKASSSISSYASQSRMSPSNSQGSGSVSGQSLYGYGGLDLIQEHYVTSYSPMELRTFHCDRVRKMPLSSLDPSMLIGFLCRDERDWKDLRERVTEMSRRYKAIFSIQDEPPSWPSDSDEMGMESVSDVDIDMDEPADEVSLSPEPEDRDAGEGEASDNADAGRPTSRREDSGGRQSEEVTTEEDPLGPVTPGPSSATQDFHDQQGDKLAESMKAMDLEEDLLGDDEEWVDPDPNLPAPTPRPREAPNYPVLPLSAVNSTATTASYVSASSSYSSLQIPQQSPSPGASGSRRGSPGMSKESDKDNEAMKDEDKENKPQQRPSKIRTKKSTGKREASSAQSQAQEYVPFPVVDDREPDDTDFYEVPSHSQSSSGFGHPGSGSGPGPRGRRRTGSGGSQNRTPIASVVTQTDSTRLTTTTTSTTGNGNGNANGNGNGNSNGNTGYRIRNVFGRDGGRTQSGGVRGIVASDPLDDASDS